MREPNDWRLLKQDQYLKGATVKWAEYKAPSPEWDHDHCEFCWSKFMEVGSDVLTAGYVTVDTEKWICAECFEDFKAEFEFKVVT